MITEVEATALLRDLESFRVERTISTNDTAKFSQAICAFANDLANSRMPGFLFIGADDAGELSGLKVSDELLRNLSGLTADGNILPAPAIVAYKVSLPSGRDIAVVEVQPSDLPPVRYRGVTYVRRGPRKAIANQAEEALLVERRTAAARSFDAQPCVGATVDDLALELFANIYRPQAVDAEAIAENHRAIDVQLASLRFFDLGRNCPTYAGIVLFGKDLLGWLPNAYVQYIRFQGAGMDSEVLSEKQFAGDLLTEVRELATFIGLIISGRPVRKSALEEVMAWNYPETAVREFLMNAILHRSYEAPAPIRFYEYSDRIEIQNPGPLYGLARPENFPTQTSYRNPILAEAMKTLGVVNRFGRGVLRAQMALERNGNPPAEFIFGEMFFGVTIRTFQ
ncbi:MAG TPA: ATP-binding protein [Bryobacteraceae bacterium]|jgi:ATP-dependent DNA helicase RecG|nr:ATP-binding protein [Bryobacteraceae bacterium]